MSRIKFILLSTAVVAFMGAFASASASAHSFSVCLKKTGGKFTESKCETSGSGEWEKFEAVGGSTGEVTGTSGVSKLKSSLLKAEILITCKKDKFKGELEAAGTSTGEVTFEECSAGNSTETFPNCEVPNIKFKFTDQLVETEGKLEDEFKPAAGSKIFVEIEIKNKSEKACLEKGKFPVEGTQLAELPEASKYKALHSLVFKPTGSKLTFNKEAATFESTDELQLVTGDNWAAS